jgi:glucose/arabinose dehydrogenase
MYFWSRVSNQSRWLAAFLCLSSIAFAQTIPTDLALVPVATATQPVAVRNARDGSNRLFIVEKGGVIKILKNGAVLATPFLTIPVSTTSEQGLLGLAFHPNFASNRKFYVTYTRAAGGTVLGTTADQVMAEYLVPLATPDVADPTTRREILSVPDLAGNHNGGDLHFGPDGYLYYSMGDGGPQNDPNEFAQNVWKKPVNGKDYYLLGKILRIDIDNTTPARLGPYYGADDKATFAQGELCAAAVGAANYAVPIDNPFVASANTCDEIYHFGMRNPWRFSFDRRTGEMFIGDVGQGAHEEVSVAPPRAPQNFGWKCFEGFTSNFTTGACSPLPPNITAPILDYAHSDNGGGFRCSIGGGYRYRGPIAQMQGLYAYNDYCSGEIWFAQKSAAGAWTTAVWQDTNGSPVGFGEDEIGNLYLIDINGTISRFSSASDNGNFFGHGFEG